MSAENELPKIPVEEIEEAEDHVRRSSWGDLDELARELVNVGQHIAALVRPIAPGRYEVIDGARRRRALLRAVDLGLIPIAGAKLRAEIREMTAIEAHEARLATAIQREDLSPLEQAEAFGIARDRHGRSVDQIAASIKRSPSYVYQHLKLLQLEQPLRELAERLSGRSLLLLAQLPKSIQHNVAKELARGSYRDEGYVYGGVERRTFISASDVEQVVADATRAIAHAPFDSSDAKLVAKAGTCGSCVKRTGTQGVLFEEAGRTDLCLDVECWDAKTVAAKALTTKKLSKQGHTVLDDEASTAALRWNSGYVKLDDKVAYGDERTWREVIGADFKPTVAFDHDGRAVDLAPADVAKQALSRDAKTTGSKTSSPSTSSGGGASSSSSAEDEWKRAKAREKAKRKARELAQSRAMVALVRHVEQHHGGSEAGAPFQRTFIAALVHGTWTETAKAVCKRRSWTIGSEGAEETIIREMSDMRAAELGGLMVEVVATRDAAYDQRWDASEPGFASLCAHCSVDLLHYERAALEELREKAERKGQSIDLDEDDGEGFDDETGDEAPAATEASIAKPATKRKSRAELDADEAEARREQMEDAYGE